MTRSPLIPSSSDSPETRRLLTGVRELVIETLQRAGVLRTAQGERIARAPTGVADSLAWQTMNRLEPPYGGAVLLPRLRADMINVPLFFAKASPSGAVRVLSGPRLDGTTPLVNGSPTGYYATGVGLSMALQDGRDWWVR